MTSFTRLLLFGLFLFGPCLATTVMAQSLLQGQHTTETLRVNPQFKDYINGRSLTGEHRTWGVFLGAGATLDERDRVLRELKEGTFLNPFTGQPFKPEEVEIFQFGHEQGLVEVIRVVSDHLEIHALSSWKDLQGKQFDFVICHSNGCPNALDAQRYGAIEAKHFFALGTDWTLKDFKPGELRGATLTRFVMKGDVVPKIPAPGSTRVGDAGFGYRFTLRFGDTPGEGVPLVWLDPPKGQHFDVLHPVRPHAIQKSYFPALSNWMQQDGSVQTQIKHYLGPMVTSPPPSVSSMPPRSLSQAGQVEKLRRQETQQPSERRNTAPRPTIDPRGGISADVQIHAEDYQ